MAERRQAKLVDFEETLPTPPVEECISARNAGHVQAGRASGGPERAHAERSSRTKALVDLPACAMSIAASLAALPTAGSLRTTFARAACSVACRIKNSLLMRAIGSRPFEVVCELP